MRVNPWHQAGAALVVGVVVLTLTPVLIHDHSATWPPDAAQLISVLLLAAAIEQRAFKAPPPILLGGSLFFLVLVVAALTDAIFRASAGKAFSSAEAALVNGCTAAPLCSWSR